MGTILSTIPMSAFGQGEELSLTNSFQNGLVVGAAQRTRVVDITDSKPRVEQFKKMSQRPSPYSISEAKAESMQNNAYEIRGSLESNLEERAHLLRLSASADRHTKYGPNGNRVTLPQLKRALDVNKNPTLTKVTESVQKFSGDLSRVKNKPFQPESWPTLDMIQGHLSKFLKTPSTLIFARFLPNRHSKKYVEICYTTFLEQNAAFLESSDKLETLIMPKEDHMKPETTEDEIKYFLLIFKTCVNSLQGQIWWNGFSLILDPTLKNRLKVAALETQPISQLLFELTGMKELEVHKTLHRLELRGQIEGSGTTPGTEKNMKHLRFRGVSAKDISVKQLRGNLITVHIPPFSPERLEY